MDQGGIDDGDRPAVPPRGGTADPSIGVVIPLFNKELTLDRCLASVLAQRLRPRQIIVVDDRSSDSSYDSARRSLAGVPGARVVRLPANGGPGPARNAGARLLDTDWIAFLDADDHWHPDFLEQMASAVAATRAGFAGSGRLQVDPRRGDEEFLLRGHPPDRAIVLEGEYWTAFRDFYPLNSSCNLIAAALFRAVGGFPENMRQREDHALWTRLWARDRFCFVNRPLANIDKSANGLSGAKPRIRDLVRMQAVLCATLARAVVFRRRGSMALARYALHTANQFGRHLVLRGLRAIAGRDA